MLDIYICLHFSAALRLRKCAIKLSLGFRQVSVIDISVARSDSVTSDADSLVFSLELLNANDVFGSVICVA